MRRLISDILKVPVLRVLFPYVSGVLLPLHPRGWFHAAASIIVICICSVVILLLYGRQFKSGWGYLNAVLLFIGFLLVGMVSQSTLEPFSQVPRGDNGMVLTCTILDEPSVRGQSCSFQAEATNLLYPGGHGMKIKERILVYLNLSLCPANDMPARGDQWMLMGDLAAPANRGNPGEFDYKGYLEGEGIWYIFHGSGRAERLAGEAGSGLAGLIGNARKKVTDGLQLAPGAAPTLQALVLGDKRLIPPAMKQDFSNAGAMHLLAVSGLHVGMIWWILNVLIAIPRGKPSGRIIKGVLVIGALWFYAAMTGFTGSVTRSVSMFTLFTVSKEISRPANTYNTLFLSAMILLALRPSRILDAGFQLSYAAVLGILALHPLISRAFTGTTGLVRRITDLVTVSIAAQVATLPLVLFYFHKFPVYFLLTNLAAIPLVTVILGLFVLMFHSSLGALNFSRSCFCSIDWECS